MSAKSGNNLGQLTSSAEKNFCFSFGLEGATQTEGFCTARPADNVLNLLFNVLSVFNDVQIRKLKFLRFVSA